MAIDYFSLQALFRFILGDFLVKNPFSMRKNKYFEFSEINNSAFLFGKILSFKKRSQQKLEINFPSRHQVANY